MNDERQWSRHTPGERMALLGVFIFGLANAFFDLGQFLGIASWLGGCCCGFMVGRVWAREDTP